MEYFLTNDWKRVELLHYLRNCPDSGPALVKWFGDSALKEYDVASNSWNITRFENVVTMFWTAARMDPKRRFTGEVCYQYFDWFYACVDFGMLKREQVTETIFGMVEQLMSSFHTLYKSLDEIIEGNEEAELQDDEEILELFKCAEDCVTKLYYQWDPKYPINETKIVSLLSSLRDVASHVQSYVQDASGCDLEESFAGIKECIGYMKISDFTWKTIVQLLNEIDEFIASAENDGGSDAGDSLADGDLFRAKRVCLCSGAGDFQI